MPGLLRPDDLKQMYSSASHTLRVLRSNASPRLKEKR